MICALGPPRARRDQFRSYRHAAATSQAASHFSWNCSGARLPEPLPTRPDRLQQLALAGAGISKNGHNHHRQDFGVRVQRVELLIRADLFEHAFANSQIVRAQAGAIETSTQHLCEPFRARPLLAAGFADEPLTRCNSQAKISSTVYWNQLPVA